MKVIVRLLGRTTVLALIAAACASLPRPPELERMDGLVADKKAWAALAGAPEATISESRQYYVMATQAYEDGDEEKTRQFAVMAKILFDTASEQARAHRARLRIDEAQQRLEQAETARAQHDQRHERFSKRVARMEKILALEDKLESEQAKSKKEKKKLATQLEKVKEEQAKAEAAQQKAEEERKKAEEIEQKTQEVRNAMATVSAKIQTAEALDAEKSDQAGMRGARDSLAQAERALVNKEFDLASKLVATADAAATKAISTARAQFAEQSKELNILAERKALLEAAAKLAHGERLDAEIVGEVERRLQHAFARERRALGLRC
jgi:colicin import membrane protein